MKYEIKGKLKSGKNNMGIDPRSGRHFPKREWADWRDEIVASLTEQRLMGRHKTIEKPAKLMVKYFRGDDRRRDISGMLDAIYHCTERAGIIKDDSLFHSISWEGQKDKDNPRVEMEIEEMDNV